MAAPLRTYVTTTLEYCWCLIFTSLVIRLNNLNILSELVLLPSFFSLVQTTFPAALRFACDDRSPTITGYNLVQINALVILATAMGILPGGNVTS